MQVTVDLMSFDTANIGSTPAQLWCRIPTRDGAQLVTNAAEALPDGVLFVAVDDADGDRAGWWPVTALDGDVAAATAMLAELCEATAAERVSGDEFGDEYVVAVAHGSLRICDAHSYVRVCDDTGAGLDGGSAYWTVDEIAEDPSLVWGAVLGALAQLR